MTSSEALSWQAANQHYLSTALAIVHEALTRHIAKLQATEIPASNHSLSQTLHSISNQLVTPSALEAICSLFGLTTFERDLLLLCAGLELDSNFPDLCATAQGDPRRIYATFSLALAALPNAHWSALLPEAPLRRWRLIEVGSGEIMALSPLRIDERILHYLTGLNYLDDRLQGLLFPVTTSSNLPASHQQIADRIVQCWQQQHTSDWTAIQLCGEEENKASIAASACNQLGLGLFAIRATDIPTNIAEREALNCLAQREAILSNSALLVDFTGLDAAETNRAIRFLDRPQAPVIITNRDPINSDRSLLKCQVNKPSITEQKTLWQNELGTFAESLNGQFESLIMQFNLNSQNIHAACLESKLENDWLNLESQNFEQLESNTFNKLWHSCRVQARSRLDDLAQRIESPATWDDLVLPELQLQTLRQIGAHVRQRSTVYESWGFSKQGARGLGISALFAGTSGTGKTMAAEVLAHELKLDLYRIDLSSVVSKYIGETEKNLRRVFDAAETGGAILLFDEADALFGKRSEVKDSHDRYANIEVSYLLQRMEAYRGLAILTTNLKNALDTAFLRRIRFVVQFPFPDAAQRTDIWRRIFPSSTPTQDLDWQKLGRLNVAGGNIRNIALNAAFLAADAREPVQMKHLLQAAQSEYSKLEKSLTQAEVGGWV